MNEDIKKQHPASKHTGSNVNKNFTTPYLPNVIPFNDEQKQWLGGFFAGLHSRLLTMGDSTATVAAGKPLTIIYGSQTGNAEGVAEQAAEEAKAHGMTATVQDMDDVELDELVNAERLLVVTSTYGEGEMPDNAQALWEAISEDHSENGPPSFANTYYSVLALGDTSYDGFCTAGKEWDARLEQLGGQRIADRIDCDIDYDEPSEEWIANVLPIITEKGSQESAAGSPVATENKKAKSKYNRKNPLAAELITQRVLTGKASSKEVCHFEFSLGDSGESYNAGDALNIIPQNRPDLVDEFLTRFAVNGDDAAPGNSGKTLRQVLSEDLEIRAPSKELLAEIAKRSNDDEINRLLENDDKEALDDFLWGKDVIDLLGCSGATLSIEELIALSKPLAPRAYSISSSIKKHANEVHLTVGSVRYKTNERDHNGVASTFLADIAKEGDKIHCYFSPNKNFAIPEDGELPIIMVGPGTGIAPFRAFLEEREATNAKGDNWLFFGDRNSASDYLYQEEIEAMQASGLLSRIDLAFSRDQKEKIYVQNRMLEHGAELFAWLERGGYFYICGDAYRMAKDVDKALHTLIGEHGNMNEDEATAYVNKLKKEKRYVRDVY